MTTTTSPNLSWYDVAPEVKELLFSAAKNWENSDESEQYMTQALAKCGADLDVLVSAYRYFFYKHNDAMALKVVSQVLEQITNLEKLPDTWEEIQPILASRKEETNIRLYLNAYSASGLVLARLGRTEEAEKIAAKVKEIDDKKEFGAAVVFDILTQPPEED